MDHYIDIEQLAVESGGAGRPVLLIHGIGSSKFTWRHVCRGLEDVVSYYAIDLPGSGQSPAPPAFQYSLDSLSAVVVDFVLSRDLRDLTIIAHSLGAGIAFLSLLKPAPSLSSRVKSLCILDGISYPQNFPPFVKALRVPVLNELLMDLVPATIQARTVLQYCYFDQHQISDEQVDEYASYLARADVRHALRQTAKLLNAREFSSYISQLKSIQVPCLLIWGRNDRVVPLPVGQRLQHELPNSRLLIVERCGHMPQEERPNAVIRALRDFILPE